MQFLQMKQHIVITSFIILVISSCEQKKENGISAKWIALSASSQNLHEGLSYIEGGNPDLSAHEAELNNVDKALEELVKSGALISKKISLKTATKLDQNALYELFKSIDHLGKKYGIYTAKEMCDMGARHRFELVKPNHNLELNVRLPQDELDILLKKVEELDLHADSKE